LDLGIVVPEKVKAEVVTFRLKGVDARKLRAIGKQLKVGQSTLARLIVEKFIREHDPEA